MQIKVKRLFRYQVGAETKELAVGVHTLPKELAEKVLKWGRAEVVVEEKPARKKRKNAPENKARLGK